MNETDALGHVSASCVRILPESQWADLDQDNESTVRGDGGSRVGEVRASTTSTMPEHKGFKLQ